VLGWGGLCSKAVGRAWWGEVRNIPRRENEAALR